MKQTFSEPNEPSRPNDSKTKASEARPPSSLWRAGLRFLDHPLFQVGLAFFSLFTFGLVDNSRGAVFPDMLKDFALNDQQGALFFFSASTASLVNNLVAFRWMERIGAYRTTQVYSVAQALGLLIIGVGSNYEMALLGAAFIGLSFGGLGYSVNVLVSEGVSAHRRLQALSGLHCTYGISSLLTPLLVSSLYHLGVSWHAVLSWVALGPFLVFLVSLLSREHRWEEIEPEAGAVSTVPAGPEGAKAPRSFAAAMYFATICTLYVMAEIAVGTRMALFARRDWGFDVDRANQFMALFFTGLFVGRLVFAVVHFKWSARRILVVSASLGAVAIALGIFYGPAWMATSGLFLSVFYPCAMSMINDEQGEHASYVIASAITVQSIGLMGMHFVLGGLSDAFGLGKALWIGPVALAGAVLALLVKNPRDWRFS